MKLNQIISAKAKADFVRSLNKNIYRKAFKGPNKFPTKHQKESLANNLRRNLTWNRRRSVFSFVNDETGSLSILIIGLFVAAVTALMVITDVAVVANAKRTLDQATEAAAMRAVQNLDKSSYYSG